MTASITAVRGRPSDPGPIGVAWVSTTLPAPSPSHLLRIKERLGLAGRGRAQHQQDQDGHDRDGRGQTRRVVVQERPQRILDVDHGA